MFKTQPRLRTGFRVKDWIRSKRVITLRDVGVELLRVAREG